MWVPEIQSDPRVWQQTLSAAKLQNQMNQKPEARSTHTSIHTALQTVGNVVLQGKRKFPLGVDALAFPFQHGIPGDSLGFTVLKSDAKPPGSFGVTK